MLDVSRRRDVRDAARRATCVTHVGHEVDALRSIDRQHFERIERVLSNMVTSRNQLKPFKSKRQKVRLNVVTLRSILCMLLISLVVFRRISKTSVDSTTNDFHEQVSRRNIAKTTQVGIVCTARPQSDLQTWLDYHRAIGISHFFIVFDAVEIPLSVQERYRRLRDVTVFASSQTQPWGQNSDIFHLKRMQKHINAPMCGVDRVFIQQALNAEFVIKEILSGKLGARLDWLFHIDSDELIFPLVGSQEPDISQFLGSLSKSIGRVIFPNYEAVPERLDNVDPFVDVTLFRRNHKHVGEEFYTKYKNIVKRDNPRNFLGYANGKSAARVLDDLRPVGVHNFEHIRSTGLKDLTLGDGVILHYGFADYSRVIGRFANCDCPKEFTHKCKRLPFDMELAHKYDELYLLRSNNNSTNVLLEQALQRWYESRVVLNPESSDFIEKFIKLGMFARITTPSIIIQRQRRTV